MILVVLGRRVKGKLLTNDGAGKRPEGADRAPDTRDRGEERSVQAICLRYRLLNNKVRALHVKIDNLTSCSRKAVREVEAS